MSKDCKQLFRRDQLAMAHSQLAVSVSHVARSALQKYPDAVTPLDTTLCTLPASSCITLPMPTRAIVPSVIAIAFCFLFNLFYSNFFVLN